MSSSSEGVHEGPFLPGGGGGIDVDSSSSSRGGRRGRGGRTPSSIQRRSWLWLAIALLLVIAVLVGIKATQIGTMIKAGKSAAPPPEAVTSATVQAVEWEVTRSAVGSLVAEHGGSLGAELFGTVREIAFDNGSFVKRGAVLIRLDTEAEQAQLGGAEAQAELARLDLQRARALRQAGTNSQADLDTIEARAQQTKANAANLRVAIAKKTIRAPFDGRIAIRQVELGQVVSPGTPIASLQSVSPIHVDFWLPQQVLIDLESGELARLRVDVAPKRTWEGKVTTINPEIDLPTRNVRVRATFANEDGFLKPGMFGNVEVVSPTKKSLLIVPQSAVIFAPYGDSVYAIKSDPKSPSGLKAEPHFVRLGDRRGDFVVVESGLQAGDTVVSTGAFKLRGPTNVIVNNNVAPDAGLAPMPTDG